jgi:hypothetical protein
MRLPFVPAPRPGTKQRSSDGDRTIEGSVSDEYVAAYAPGRPAWIHPTGSATLVKAGSDLVLSLHYTANGKAARDRSKVGLVFAKEPPQRRVFRTGVVNYDLAIPPGDPDYSVSASRALNLDCEVLQVAAHMHLRGKSMEMRAIYPTGEQEILMRVPRYDFNWQLEYEFAERKRLPKGTRIEAVATYDNSANNPYNPDPKAEVRWGDQSWEEMLVGFMFVAIDPKANVEEIFVRPKPQNQQ